MWDCGDIDSKAVLRAWLEERPTVVLSVPAERAEERHFWHVASSSASVVSTPSGSTYGTTAYTAPDLHIVSGFYALTMPLLPDGSVSTAIADGLKTAKALKKSARSA
jgi:hypothetical protein